MATLEREWHLHSSAPLPLVPIGWAVGLAAKQVRAVSEQTSLATAGNRTSGCHSRSLGSVVNDMSWFP